MAKKTEKMWAIADPDLGLYVGTYMTRRDAINHFGREQGWSWKQFYRRGLRCVRVTITYEAPHA